MLAVSDWGHALQVGLVTYLLAVLVWGLLTNVLPGVWREIIRPALRDRRRP